MFLKNKIYRLLPLSCLQILDTLMLVVTAWTYISNETFSDMTSLRIVDLSCNNIVKIQPNTFNQAGLHILKLNVAYNNLRHIDLSNLMPLKKVCFVNYESNQLSDLVNELGYAPYRSIGYKDNESRGIIRLSNNSLSRLPDPSSFGVPSLTYLSFYVRFWIGLSKNNIHCDCNMQPLFKALLPPLLRHMVHIDTAKLTCSTPSHLSDLKIDSRLKEEYLLDLICNYTICPKGCRCFYCPQQNRTVINCTNAGFKDIMEIDINDVTKWQLRYNRDEFLEAKIHVLLPNNSFRRIPNKNFLVRTHLLDLSANNLKYIEGIDLTKIANWCYY